MVYSLQYKSLSITNYVMLAVFILCIAVQYNDPDPGIWMLIYGLAAIVCFLASRNQMHWILPALICLIVFAWGLKLAYQVPESFSFNEIVFSSWSMKNYGVEIVRELGGLAIILFWMIVLTLTKNPGLAKS